METRYAFNDACIRWVDRVALRVPAERHWLFVGADSEWIENAFSSDWIGEEESASAVDLPGFGGSWSATDRPWFFHEHSALIRTSMEKLCKMHPQVVLVTQGWVSATAVPALLTLPRALRGSVALWVRMGKFSLRKPPKLENARLRRILGESWPGILEARVWERALSRLEIQTVDIETVNPIVAAEAVRNALKRIELRQRAA